MDYVRSEGDGVGQLHVDSISLVFKTDTCFSLYHYQLSHYITTQHIIIQIRTNDKTHKASKN